MDLIDNALAREQTLCEARLANRVVYRGLSSVECESCGDVIPEARRQVIAGCTLCVYCTAAEERRR